MVKIVNGIKRYGVAITATPSKPAADNKVCVQSDNNFGKTSSITLKKKKKIR